MQPIIYFVDKSKGRIPRHRHRHPSEDPREEIARVGRMYRRIERVGVDFGVVECGLYATAKSSAVRVVSVSGPVSRHSAVKPEALATALSSIEVLSN